MQSNPTFPPARYIPFRDSHIAELFDVTPVALKKAAAAACTKLKDREPLQPNTALNHIAKQLGFNGGFAGYRQEYDSTLKGFMKDHALARRVDLINQPDKGFALVSLKPRQVSDRLFSSVTPRPDKLFTGYGVDWFALNNRHFRHNPWTSHPEFKQYCLPFEVVMRAVRAANAESPSQEQLVLEAAVTACAFTIRGGNSNLLGDYLLGFEEGKAAGMKFVPKIYGDKNCPPDALNAGVGQTQEVARVFRTWLALQVTGWVEIVWYNARLAFLKGPHGEYDFLFHGFRDQVFNHETFGPFLRNADVPKSNDEYHFKRWLYFDYREWLEQDEHVSEMAFYSAERLAKDHPGADWVLREGLILKGSYQPPGKTAGAAEGFIETTVNGKRLFVSNLVSIGMFRAFMTENAVYALYSREPEDVDRWETVNSDQNDGLPAAVTWYDANAYAAWISKTRGLPVRLLTDEEYRQIASPIIRPPGNVPMEEFLDSEHERLCRFYTPGGAPLPNHPPYMPEGDFQALQFRYIPEVMNWRRSESGLVFLVSHHFGEWLNENAAAVNSRSLSSLCYLDFPPAKGRFAATSTGKYKSKKIGFRLCYLGETTGDSGQNPETRPR